MAQSLFWQLAGGEGIRNTWERWKSEGYEDQWEAFWTLTEVPEEWKDEVRGRDWARTTCLNDLRSMMKLASNPYLLTQMVYIYGEHQQLPESRIELFGEFVKDLIFRETEARPENYYQKADQEALQHELKQLAWQLQSRTGSLEEARTILPRCDAEKIMPLPHLEFSAAASLLDLSKDNVRFSHQLLQEFFTAQSFEAHIAQGLKATQLWKPESWWETNGWEEAAKLAAEYQAEPNSFLTWLAAGNPRLAVEIAREQGLLDQKETLFADYKAGWQHAITDIEHYPNPHERHAISTSLAWLDWDNRSGIGLNDDGLPDINWLEVPEGEFIYGEADSKQTLMLDTFSISQFPVTNLQFRAFVDAGGYEDEQWWEGLEKPEDLPNHSWTESNRPVESINWYDAMAFCRWLSNQTGKDIRLPTEQQWEKASRGSEGVKYSWGNEYISGYANIDETWGNIGEFKLKQTSAVGLYSQAQSPHQILDMSGNVFEWCLNKYEEPDSISTDASGDSRVVRGGSWLNGSVNCRSSFRDGWRPLGRGDLQGFRLCCFSPISDL